MMKYANACMPPGLWAARMIIFKIVLHHQLPSNPCDLLPVTSLNQEDPCDPELGQILPKDDVDFLSQTREQGQLPYWTLPLPQKRVFMCSSKLIIILWLSYPFCWWGQLRFHKLSYPTAPSQMTWYFFPKGRASYLIVSPFFPHICHVPVSSPNFVSELPMYTDMLTFLFGLKPSAEL